MGTYGPAADQGPESELPASGPSRWRRVLGRSRWGRPTRQDAVAGFVTGLFSIPEGMAYASIGGFNPLLGLYSGMVPTAVGSLFSRTVLMTTTLTSAIALTSHSVLDEAGLDADDPRHIATLTILVGAFMLLFGLLGMGSLMSFVSNAVMTGFTTGIAIQILAGVIEDATGYRTSAHNTLAKLGDAVIHVGSWEPTSTVVAAATVACWFALHAVERLRAFAILLALIIASLPVVVLDLDVRLVGDIGTIPRSLPQPVVPDPGVAPELITGAVAVALVALAQAAGIGAAVPNPDGTRSNVSGDFTAQGVANIAGGFFRALPTGGSMSRTGVATSAGARTRWAGVFAGIVLAVLVLVAGPLAEQIPMPVIGGLIVVIAGELIIGRLGDIRLVARTGPLPTVAMIATFVATTQLPLQDAILLGAGLSLLLFCVNAQRRARIRALERDARGRWRTTDVPPRVEPGTVTVLHYEGVSMFAEVARLDEEWPALAEAREAVVIFHVRTLPDVPSSTIIKALAQRAHQLTDHGSRLMVVGLDPTLMKVFDRTGLSSILGSENVVMRTPTFFEALDHAYDDALAWTRGQRPRESG
ncbi:SulP family inorganic anion transporter [Aeromicrobium sp. IC_218]|uniref:SulP family inorganic anion transporter n=1 Tax=Aeromicrobium sp. IC_218 TaxID=2545468 RepID=UPI00103B2F1E|nr:SulP family inorganic anion transporter [Aeromicrobium sp. IC_218]TCI97626.1 SulP family inorganic anion transporter [Aeromicrobium sp. IC_218]